MHELQETASGLRWKVLIRQGWVDFLSTKTPNVADPSGLLLLPEEVSTQQLEQLGSQHLPLQIESKQNESTKAIQNLGDNVAWIQAELHKALTMRLGPVNSKQVIKEEPLANYGLGAWLV